MIRVVGMIFCCDKGSQLYCHFKKKLTASTGPRVQGLGFWSEDRANSEEFCAICVND